MSHGSTFAPNELAMVAGLAMLHELDVERLVDRSARLGGHLLELTRPFVDEFDVVKDVRGLGLMWAIEFEGNGMKYRMLERARRGLFAQLVVVPLFTEHRILTQVDGFVDALRETVAQAQRMPSSLTKFALTAAGIRS
jgi:ornithine--oxo-acid transaminase